MAIKIHVWLINLISFLFLNEKEPLEVFRIDTMFPTQDFFLSLSYLKKNQTHFCYGSFVDWG